MSDITYDMLNRMYEEASKATIVPMVGYGSKESFMELLGEDLFNIGVTEGWVTESPEGYWIIDRRSK